MKISATDKPQYFTSRLNPVKPFSIATKLGPLHFSEVNPNEMLKGNFLDTVGDFFCRNFASFTDDPYWLAYNSKKNKDYIRNGYIDYLIPKIKYDDGNLTMLIAKDNLGKIRGGSISYSFLEVPGASQNTCYIDSLAVDKKFRGYNIGKILVDKTLDINKNTFTDVFLKGEVKATGFYEKLGFTQMSENDIRQKEVVKLIAAQGDGYPDYVHFFTKPLQNDKPRWYEVLSKLLQRYE